MLSRRLAFEWLLVLAATSLLVAWAAAGGWTRAVDNRLYDLAAGWAAGEPDERILVIEIDDASLREIGRWPWPRETHRRLLDVLAAAGPRAVGYDVLFVEPTGDDAALAAAMRRAGRVYLPGLVRRERLAIGPDELILPVPVLGDAAHGVGIAELMLDEDGLVRRADTAVTIEGRSLPQLATMLARDVAPDLAMPRREPFLLPFVPGDSFRRVSFASALRGEVPAELVRDRIVLVGATAQGMGDIYSVPSSAGALMAGVQIQANLLAALLGGGVIAPLQRAAVVGLSLLPTWLVLLAFLRLRPATNLRLALAALAGIVALSLALVPLARIWFPPGAALLGVVLVYILWGWRRLAATGQFIVRQATALQAEPGIATGLVRRDALDDSIAYEANQLQDIIGQLRALRHFAVDVIAHLPDATLVVDADGTIRLANEAAARLFEGDVQGRPFALFLARLLDGATREGSRIGRPGGQMLVMSDAPLSGGGHIIRLADMTDLQRATDEREEVLQFLSHDLRSPHAAILTLLEAGMLGDGKRPDGVAPAMIERVRAHARHGLRLADDFVQLARARRRPIVPEPVDLTDIAREAIDMVWPRAVERTIRVEDGSADGETWVLGDHAMLLRAAVNLLDNAVKFAPEGARVDIAVAREGDRVRLAVSGPGPEMPPGRAERPFALYAEGRDVGGRASIGLGLAFVQATAIRHGGSASYRYQAGYGATFTILLPSAGDD